MHCEQTLSDTDLVTAIRADTPGMFERLFHWYWESLYRAAFNRLKDTAEAEDVVQDLFAELWERRHNLHIDASLQAYLHTALKYKIIKRAARADLQKQAFDHLAAQMSLLETDVIDLMHANEINQTLKQAISRFPENMQRIFALRTADFTIREIAEALGLSEQTVKNNTTAALHRLRFALAQKHPDIPPSFYLALLALFTQN